MRDGIAVLVLIVAALFVAAMTYALAMAPR
jgi:hypothetical protein